jgi:hypothetical protein
MDYLQAARIAYDGLNAGNIEPLANLLGPHSEWFEAENMFAWQGRPWTGRDEIVQGLAVVVRSFAPFQMEISRWVDAGPTVLVHGRYRGKHVESGRLLDAQVAHVLDFEDDKIVRFQQYTDTWQWASVSGFQPPPVT